MLQCVIVALYFLLDLKLYNEPDIFVRSFFSFCAPVTDVSPVTATFLCNLQVSIGVTPVLTDRDWSLQPSNVCFSP